MPTFPRPLRAIALAVPLAAVVTLVAPAVAAVAATTTTGVRCTIIGTGHADHLEGTAGRDVICGLGGNDTIDGLGGNDVIDAGSGNDTVSGGSGNDVLSGGPGKDQISGGSGSDTEYGGTGNDEIYGGSGADLILGQSGNDDINGQSGGDEINGGSGTDWCTIGAGDTEKSCVYDKTAPGADIGSLTLATTSIDVTEADRQLPVSVRLHDDTGVAGAAAALFNGNQYTRNSALHLTSGTVRNGVWSGVITVPRYALPGSFYVGLDITDRVGRYASDANPQQQVAVKDATPDTQPPVVRSVSVPSSPIDVRTKDGSVTFTAHITDDAAGVKTAAACLYAPGAAPEWVQQPCVGMTRSKGTAQDGTWKVTIPLPAKSVGGTWDVGVWVADAFGVGGEEYYLGSDMYHWQQVRNAGYPTNPHEHDLGGGRFTVLGSTDTHPPRLVAVKVSRTSIDTLTSDQTVDLYVHAQDAKGEGVQRVQAWMGAIDEANAQIQVQQDPIVLYQGTEQDGWWRITLHFAQGTPPGGYRFDVDISDRVHTVFYLQEGDLTRPDQARFPAGSLLTTGGAAWDGVITVVANPAG